MNLIVSKCCASPLVVRNSEEGTNFYTCQSCRLPTDQMEYPFKTVAQMEKWINRKKAYLGVAYTANPDLTVKSNMRYVAFLVGCVIGIILFWALVAI